MAKNGSRSAGSQPSFRATDRPDPSSVDAVLNSDRVNLEHVTAADIAAVRDCIREHLLQMHPSFIGWLRNGARMTAMPRTHSDDDGNRATVLRYVIQEQNGGASAQMDGLFLHPEHGWSVRGLPSELLDAK
ncbi:MAG: hypothetical protein PHW10_02410 [Candidatus Peribacteraceae bacterium]|nr:hypothetical protein [Candidatus Peribacteraceae bacterium]